MLSQKFLPASLSKLSMQARTLPIRSSSQSISHIPSPSQRSLLLQVPMSSFTTDLDKVGTVLIGSTVQALVFRQAPHGAIRYHPHLALVRNRWILSTSASVLLTCVLLAPPLAEVLDITTEEAKAMAKIIIDIQERKVTVASINKKINSFVSSTAGVKAIFDSPSAVAQVIAYCLLFFVENDGLLDIRQPTPGSYLFYFMDNRLLNRTELQNNTQACTVVFMSLGIPLRYCTSADKAATLVAYLNHLPIHMFRNPQAALGYAQLQNMPAFNSSILLPPSLPPAVAVVPPPQPQVNAVPTHLTTGLSVPQLKALAARLGVAVQGGEYEMYHTLFLHLNPNQQAIVHPHVSGDCQLKAEWNNGKHTFKVSFAVKHQYKTPLSCKTWPEIKPMLRALQVSAPSLGCNAL